MRLTTALLGLSAAAATALAQSTSSVLYVTNQCPELVYVRYSTEAPGHYQQAQKTLSAGQAFEVRMLGLGYSVGLYVDPDFFSTSVPKLIVGYSVDQNDELLYYSVTTDAGNPFAGQAWRLASGNSQCTPVSQPNGVTYACAAGSYLIFTLCA